MVNCNMYTMQNLTHEGRKKLSTFCRRYSRIHLLEWQEVFSDSPRFLPSNIIDKKSAVGAIHDIPLLWSHLGDTEMQTVGTSIISSTAFDALQIRTNQISISRAFLRGVYRLPMDPLTKGQWWVSIAGHHLMNLTLPSMSGSLCLIFIIPSFLYVSLHMYLSIICNYHQVSNIWRTLVGNYIVRCGWSISFRRCSNYIILDSTHCLKGLGKADFKTRWESFKFYDLVRIILEFWRYFKITVRFT